MYTDTTPPITTAAEVLDGVAGVREQLRLLDRGLVVLAVEWAKHNPTEPDPPEHPGTEGAEEQWVFDQLNAQGCVTFDDTTVAEFAIAAGLTEYSARKLIRESLMLVHLLPRVWSRVLAGGLDVWRARHLAGDCFDLSTAAIDFVDQQMSERSVRVTLTSRERIITEARKRFMPDAEEAAEEASKNMRKVDIFTHEQRHGVACVFGQLDLPDALALDAALTVGAQALKDAGSDAPLDVRRSWALGDLARAATGRAPAPSALPGSRPRWNGKGANPPNVKLFIHLPHSTFLNSGSPYEPADSIGIVEGSGLAGEIVCDSTTIREWFTRPTTAGEFAPVIKIRPILDVDEDANADGYTPTRRIREHVHLSHNSCTFPFCTRPAHRCDVDHIDPWKPDGSGGATCTCNLAPLCRTHHRLKTHADNAPVTNGEHGKWSYVKLGDEEYFWTGPRGMQFIRNNSGTYNAGPGRDVGAPAHPGALTPPSTAPPVALADDEHRERTENMIDRLLSKASLTRGVHNRDYSPMWSMPPHKASSAPPDEYPFLDEDDPGGSITFLVPYTPTPGTLEWELAHPQQAAS